ncbi:DUF1876 domain-containing protein [Streptomyces sp. G-G2]|uniref:DUF1876 domain-containing protein n=1 Tax=Streptomyces sp. G-G2 TaxID=3046201 RepID=UPI0024B9463A|nr:DUF1876 domain-containing protein [Streptomyces sp. G-G2]MDJ0385675.1 DUF1876 domain-containing protein [Streptomyces sp. G-G2]
MSTLVGWHVELEFSEEGHRTGTAALLRLSDGSELRGRGYAMRHPSDPEQLRVGEEIAGARALMDLASQLLQKAHAEIDATTGRHSYPINH